MPTLISIHQHLSSKSNTHTHFNKFPFNIFCFYIFDWNIFRQPAPPPSPQPGCQYCSHCNSCITTTKTTTTALAGSPLPQHHHPSPHGTDTAKVTTRTTHYNTSTSGYPDNKGPPYPNDHSPTYAIPVDNTPRSNYPPNQGGPPVSVFIWIHLLFNSFILYFIFLFIRDLLYISIQLLITLRTILLMDEVSPVHSLLEICLRRHLRVLSLALRVQHLANKSPLKDWMNWWLISQDMRFLFNLYIFININSLFYFWLIKFCRTIELIMMVWECVLTQLVDREDRLMEIWL